MRCSQISAVKVAEISELIQKALRVDNEARLKHCMTVFNIQTIIKQARLSAFKSHASVSFMTKILPYMIGL